MPVALSRRVIAFAVAVVMYASGAVFVATQAGAGSPAPTVNPTTVSPGDQITVSEVCLNPEAEVGVYPGWLGPYVKPTTTPIVEQTGIVTDAADQWSTTLTIPADAAPGPYTVFATCSDGLPGGAGWPYEAVELTVLASETTTTTTMADATTTTMADATTTTTPAADAEPAAAVTGSPSYTG